MNHSHEHTQKQDADVLAKLRALLLPFLRMLLPHPDIKEAKALVKDKAEAEWLRVFGAELMRLELEVKEQEKRCADETKAMAALEHQQRNTKPYRKFPTAQGGNDHQETPFSLWEMKDKLAFPFCLMAALLVLGAGMVNIYSNIMASGSPTFLEQPWLAAMLSVLLPVSCSISKFFAEMIETDRYRRLYIRLVFGLTLLVALIWTVLFAQVYEGPNAGLDFDELDQTDQLSSWLTGCQLLLESLAGSSLFLMSSDIHSKYSPGSYGRNQEDLMLQEIKDLRKPEYDANRQERNHSRARMAELQATRKSFVSEMLALYVSMRRRFDDSAPS